MNNLKLITQYSPWFIIVCFLAGTGYAFLLYTKKYSWSKNLNVFLSALRFLLVSFLCFLLLGPLLKHFKNQLEPPSIVIGIDNSQSISYAADTVQLGAFKKQIAALASTLKDANASVEVRLLDKTIPLDQLDHIKFNGATSDLTKMLSEVQSDYANRNLAAMVLVSDGIYNQGIAPNYKTYNFPVYTLGLGDTVPKKDISLKSLLYNKISYSGNKFPIVAEIHNSGFRNQNVTVYLKQNKKIVDKKRIFLSTGRDIQEVEFLVNPEKNGLLHYTVEIEPLKEEFTRDNNTAHAYIEVIDGKEKILLVACCPHPDIKAIKAAIEKKQNYELQVYIPGVNEFKNDKFDLVIFHQVPDIFNTARDLKDKFIKDGTSILFIVGAQTNLNAFNNDNTMLKISGRYGQTDNILPVFNEAFDKFRFEPEDQKMLASYPPVSVPFGNYIPGTDAEVILYQKVGVVSTQKPLLSVSSKPRKMGVLNGEGIWQWRLHEFNETKDTKIFDKVITSLVQYLSSKDDKRKFRVYPVSNEFSVSEPVLFEVETYNDIYEKIFGQKIDLKITDESGNAISYAFENGENAPRFEVKGLKQGVYKYTASATLLGRSEKTQGEFSIKDLNLEAQNITADHELLRLLSSATGGKFLPAARADELLEIIGKNKFQSIIHTNEEFDEIINLPWIGLLLLLLAFTEWFIRKYKGGY